MKYYIIAGEASGDLHGSHLIKALKKTDPNASIRCWGGDLMEAAGGQLVKHYRDLAFMGFLEVIRNIRTIFKNLRFCKEDISGYQPDVIVYIDYPGFNLRIAKWAKHNNFKNHYYISPQVWAWKENRVKDMKRDLDALYVILPFEKDFFENKHHFPVHFVGHPLMDIIPEHKNNPSFFNENKLDEEFPIVALLPGSRKQEIKKMLPLFLSIVPHFPKRQFVIAAAPGIPQEWYASFLKNSRVAIIYNKTYDLLHHAEAAIVTSGTATLETALFGVPQMVCYRSSLLNYLIAKQILNLKFISLVNLIMDKKLVEELIQQHCNVAAISTELKRIISDDGKAAIQASYQTLFKSLKGNGAALQTAQMIVKAIG